MIPISPEAVTAAFLAAILILSLRAEFASQEQKRPGRYSPMLWVGVALIGIVHILLVLGYEGFASVAAPVAIVLVLVGWLISRFGPGWDG